jgi:hypothetical protein
VLLITVGPWVVAAIGGAVARHRGEDWLVIGAPSPVYAFYVTSWLESSHVGSELPVVELGAGCSLLWGLTGVALLAAAARRSRRAVRESDAAIASAEAALLAEEAP